jgi:hypothetical protein
MARFAAWAALAVAVGAFVGCGPAKELPDAVPARTEPTEAPVAVPAASEPAAVAYLEKAVRAYTGNRPDLVAKGKASRVVMKGRQYKVGDVPFVEVVRTVSAVWPDRYRDTDEQQGQKSVLTAYLHRPNFVVVKDGQEQVLTGNLEREQNFVTDAMGPYWTTLFLLQTAPKTVAYDLRQKAFLPPGSAQAIPVQTLRVSSSDFLAYQLTFDAKTDLLLRVDFTSVLFGTATRQTWTMADHKTTPEGLFLPSKMELRVNDSVGEEWTVEKWEFPATIPDSEFSPPKK